MGDFIDALNFLNLTAKKQVYVAAHELVLLGTLVKSQLLPPAQVSENFLAIISTLNYLLLMQSFMGCYEHLAAVTTIICQEKQKTKNNKAGKYIGCCSIIILWVFYMLINFISSLNTLNNWKSKHVTREQDFGYCSIVGHNEISEFLYAALVVCPEVLFSVLISYSRGFMIVLLL